MPLGQMQAQHLPVFTCHCCTRMQGYSLEGIIKSTTGGNTDR
jgi:hypothetical protein